jgi:nanoRNase/pAp phosphatase (c-di-AMP/oligoRNAs hydrolase)
VAGGVIIDVNHIAARFDGGGHVHAAGARFQGSLDETVEQVRRACEDYFDSGAAD